MYNGIEKGTGKVASGIQHDTLVIYYVQERLIQTRIGM